MQRSDDVTALLAESQEAIDDAQRQFDQSNDAIRALGFDPEKVRASMAGRLGSKERQESEHLVAQDMADVEREVDQAKARLSFSANGNKGGRKPRSMV